MLRTDLFEVGSNCGNFVNKILHTEDATFFELLLNNGIGGDGDPLLVNLAISTFVDEFTDRFKIWLAGDGSDRILL